MKILKPGTKFRAVWTEYGGQVYYGEIKSYSDVDDYYRCTIRNEANTFINPHYLMPASFLAPNKYRVEVTILNGEVSDPEYLELFI